MTCHSYRYVISYQISFLFFCFFDRFRFLFSVVATESSWISYLTSSNFQENFQICWWFVGVSIWISFDNLQSRLFRSIVSRNMWPIYSSVNIYIYIYLLIYTRHRYITRLCCFKDWECLIYILGWSDIEKFLNLNLLLWAKVVFMIGLKDLKIFWKNINILPTRIDVE